MPPREAYDWLRNHCMETARLESTISLLHWDQGTNIPAAGHNHRAEQIAALTRVVHARRTDERIGEALESCVPLELADGPESDLAANLRGWRREFTRASRIPANLAVAIARTASEGESAWERLRPENNWAAFLPYLDELVKLRREEAEAVGYESEPYDALLDEYEPGETTASITPLFAELKRTTVSLLDRILGSGKEPKIALVGRRYPLADQERLVRHVIRTLGFDFTGGRMDTTVHPFCTRIGPGDIRITTRYREDDFAESFFGAIHECGHALYSQGLPGAHFGTPCGRSASLGIHESQSRMWENMVARSRGFWVHFLPLASYALDSLRGIGTDAFHFAVNTVQPGLIRTDADEVTYNLHILLRFDLELALLRGDLRAADIPDAWNEGMRELLGLTPPDHASGAMQDVHWASGLIGYFPTYALGNIYAAQFMETIRAGIGNPDAMFARGEFAPLLDWLRTNIHSRAARQTPREIVRAVTGQDPTPAPLAAHLARKYETLYGLRPSA
ncbi:carboxypeptidase Taq [Desulfobaculum xiamenense]|uniref:Metal-dependent carboxypeptidase n=1 Tax=Desulfobaculum xiamenense TaxID=995050 RepID=A0A846QHC9_9BACT|nr:carboxypeptidase M32 [Desulfobaculum xiamenense]NJB67621.1 carboxypeptidase Taq [Desulfobaculum xiamenense]